MSRAAENLGENVTKNFYEGIEEPVRVPAMLDAGLTGDLHEETAKAVAHYWQTRSAQRLKQQEGGKADQGLRSAVTGGAQMDGFVDLFSELVIQAGIPGRFIFRKKSVELPGFFRPTKEWDLLVVRDRRLIAAIEAKSQVGPSFGNNFNNRIEEAMGSALDLWTAYRERAFLDSAQPFLGYFFMLEDCDTSNRPVSVQEPHFKVFPEFNGASYIRRYELFCRKLVLERHYTASAFITSTVEGWSKRHLQDAGRRSFHRTLRKRHLSPKRRLPRDMMEPTFHKLINGDARDLSFLGDESVHLVVTSPPYWNLKRYNENPDQLGIFRTTKHSCLNWRRSGGMSFASLYPAAVWSASSAMSAWRGEISGATWCSLCMRTFV